MAKALRVLGVLVLALLAAEPVDSEARLAMRVSAYSPGVLTVRLSVVAAPENRALLVIAESRDLYRSSQIQLDGDSAPRTSVFELRGLSASMYEVTGVLIGSNGPRAKVTRIARVLPDRRGR
jgi:hypothetical protein